MKIRIKELTIDFEIIDEVLSKRVISQDPTFDFTPIYQKYPRKVGKTLGLKICKRSIKTQEDYDLLMKAVTRYHDECVREAKKPEYIRHFSSFMNHWRDYLDHDYGTVAKAPSKQVPLIKDESWMYEHEKDL